MKLSAIMTPPVAVDAGASVSEFVNEYVFRHHRRAFPVVEDGMFAGMIDVRSIKGVAPSAWPFLTIRKFLLNPDTYCILTPDLDAGEALRRLTAGQRPEAPVVLNGVLLGMLSRNDVLNLISVKSDLAA
jgi:CBS domain-containing protein